MSGSSPCSHAWSICLFGGHHALENTITRTCRWTCAIPVDGMPARPGHVSQVTCAERVWCQESPGPIHLCGSMLPAVATPPALRIVRTCTLLDWLFCCSIGFIMVEITRSGREQTLDGFRSGVKSTLFGVGTVTSFGSCCAANPSWPSPGTLCDSDTILEKTHFKAPRPLVNSKSDYTSPEMTLMHVREVTGKT